MADLQKRAKRTQKKARKRAKVARKTVEQTSVRARAQFVAGLAVAIGAAVATARLLKGSDQAHYSPEPDVGRPNEPDRPAGTTPAPGATPSAFPRA
jgi:hypothetical protein